MPKTFLEKVAPMIANWYNISGVQLLFAPPSITTIGFLIVGSVTAIAGRSIPGNLPRPNKLDAIAAPVEPAATTASELPCATASTARTIDDFFFLRIACPGASPISMISLAWVILISSLLVSILIRFWRLPPFPQSE